MKENLETLERLRDVYCRFINCLRADGGSIQDICIVGSMALCKLGLDPICSPHDIDIEMVCDKDVERHLQLLARSQNFTMDTCRVGNYPDAGPEARMKNVTWTHKPYRFLFQGVEINVWVVKRLSHRWIEDLEHIKWAVVGDVLHTKCAYRRPKDYAFMNRAIRWLTNVIEPEQERKPLTNNSNNKDEKE